MPVIRRTALLVTVAGPLNYRGGVLTPDGRILPTTQDQVQVA